MSSTMGSRGAGDLDKDLRGVWGGCGWKKGGGAARSFEKFSSYPGKMVWVDASYGSQSLQVAAAAGLLGYRGAGNAQAAEPLAPSTQNPAHS